jgi:hypothetical protein
MGACVRVRLHAWPRRSGTGFGIKLSGYRHSPSNRCSRETSSLSAKLPHVITERGLRAGVRAAHVFVLISQRVKDGAIVTLVTATLSGHTRENALKTLKGFHLASDLSNVLLGDTFYLATSSASAVGKSQEDTNLFNGKAQLTGTPDKDQTPFVLVAIEPMPTSAARRLRH